MYCCSGIQEKIKRNGRKIHFQQLLFLQLCELGDVILTFISWVVLCKNIFDFPMARLKNLQCHIVHRIFQKVWKFPTVMPWPTFLQINNNCHKKMKNKCFLTLLFTYFSNLFVIINLQRIFLNSQNNIPLSILY